MKRTGFRRPTGEKLDAALKRQRESRAASVRRSQDKVRENGGRKPLPTRNHERQAKMKAVEFGPQSEECRHLPCCVCFPWMYTKDFLALEHRSPVRISDPHHVVKRPGGTDADTIPLCMGPNGHHARCSAVGSSEQDVIREAKRGAGYFKYVARLLNAELRGNIDQDLLTPPPVTPETRTVGNRSGTMPAGRSDGTRDSRRSKKGVR